MTIIRVALSNQSREIRTLFNDAKEELHEELLLKRNGSQIADIDCSTTEFHLRVSTTRHVAAATKTLRNALDRYGVSKFVTIERL